MIAGGKRGERKNKSHEITDGVSTAQVEMKPGEFLFFLFFNMVVVVVSIMGMANNAAYISYPYLFII